MPDSEIVALLREATRGLLYPSETDAPFEVVAWAGETGAPAPARLLALTGHKAGTPVEAVALEDFFGELTQEQDWHGEAEKADVRRYRQLREIIEKRLADAKVYRVGKTRVEIYILGRAPEGGWLGVKTAAVET
jgi:hypothetical protein